MRWPKSSIRRCRSAGADERPDHFQDAAHRLGELCGAARRSRLGATTTPATAVTLDLDADDGMVEQVLEGALELAQEEALADEQVRELSELVVF